MADGVPGEDHPEERSVVDVRLPDREDLLVSFVPDGGTAGPDLVVTVAQDRGGRRVRVPVGDQLELVWLDRDTPRARTAELLAVDLGAEPTWRLAFRGHSRSAQRRGAVRAPLSLPTELADGDQVLRGTSLDLSETGLRGRWPVTTDWPDTGDTVTATVELTMGRWVTGTADVRRAFRSGDGWLEASVVFTDLSEREQDQLRARVFERLRELARRG
ncbi:PilZ domain-containing protein [Modestobacter sp. Leaf380]|uniref:PilZ domain-containing protein n=1 Tax=Modestobacter sp. Leaf380 TaxID=1736356 RepID=UPI0006FC3EAF|nr:PilZ domain-containing protein [Modestobacter sp. Leaf380]KQS66877.1 hypothetical protein ASG41_10800 [Modestobacter sp. Leaf380]